MYIHACIHVLHNEVSTCVSITQGASKLRERIEPNEQATEIPEPVQKGVHVAKKASG